MEIRAAASPLRLRDGCSSGADAVLRSLGIRPEGGGFGSGESRPPPPSSSRISSSSSCEKTGLGSRFRFLSTVAVGSFSLRSGDGCFFSSFTTGGAANKTVAEAVVGTEGDAALLFFSRRSDDRWSDLLLLDFEEEEELLRPELLLLLEVPLEELLLLFPSRSFPLLLFLLGLFSDLDRCFSSVLGRMTSWRVEGAASCFLARTLGSRIRGSLLSLSSAACNEGDQVPLPGDTGGRGGGGAVGLLLASLGRRSLGLDRTYKSIKEKDFKLRNIPEDIINRRGRI